MVVQFDGIVGGFNYIICDVFFNVQDNDNLCIIVIVMGNVLGFFIMEGGILVVGVEVILCDDMMEDMMMIEMDGLYDFDLYMEEVY